MIDQVKIGGMNHTIEIISDLHYIDNEDKKHLLYGQHNSQLSKIKILAEASLDQQKSTLIHEVMHGILHQAHVEDHPEHELVILGYGLYQVFRDNPQLVALIVEK